MPPSRYVDDFDDDGLDDDYDHEDADGMTAEDEASMAEGTAAVRKELGIENSKKVTLQQIQDALWNYYYDVPKSVSYLRKTFLAPPPPAAKPTPKPTPPAKTSEGMSFDTLLNPLHSFFVEATGADQKCPPAAQAQHALYPTFPLLDEHSYVSKDSFFHDMPWLHTPRDRQALFLEPYRPRGGLLGGGDGSGMSKLQKLAAARKKKADDAKQQEKTAQIEKGVGHMHVSDPQEEAEAKPVPIAKRQKLSPETTQPAPTKDQTDLSKGNPSRIHTTGDSHREISEPVSDKVSSQPKPSAFARTLFDSAPGASRSRTEDIFPLPSTQSSLFSAESFSQPSPDDIVFEAQSKGSGFAKAK